jgi:hypothetical protein
MKLAQGWTRLGIFHHSKFRLSLLDYHGCCCATPIRNHAMFHKAFFVFALVGGLSCLAQQATAQNSHVPVHGAGWPIQNGVKHQPTRGAVGGEFSRSQAEETDKLYDELMSNSFSATHHSGTARMR